VVYFQGDTFCTIPDVVLRADKDDAKHACAPPR
jgi:hypothetical protein